ncbi:head GIN domain-containing protein [Mariniflexile sp. HMF6888]|uniref:head GIN domain-containing protein n=1 Tax=Mariniflexile sp. HMF6888 TaxID=3373086 RepID=UPI0037901FBB
MTTLAKIIVATLISLSLFSCNFDINIHSGIEGNGNVTIEKRNINQPFSAIKATEGLNVYVTQSDNEDISVEADENLQDIIITEVVDNVLKIHTKKNIGKYTSKKVMVSFRDISSMIATSGSNVKSTNTLVVKHLDLETSSGSHVDLSINAANLNCKSSSGSNLKLSGKTIKLTAEASSGSTIKAKDMEAQSSYANASSGANITVNTSKELTAKASSGGHITYFGNPEKVTKNDSVSGSITKQ